MLTAVHRSTIRSTSAATASSTALAITPSTTLASTTSAPPLSPGYTCLPSVSLSLHHTHTLNHSYGQYFTLWDRVCKSYEPAEKTNTLFGEKLNTSYSEVWSRSGDLPVVAYQHSLRRSASTSPSARTRPRSLRRIRRRRRHESLPAQPLSPLLLHEPPSFRHAAASPLWPTSPARFRRVSCSEGRVRKNEERDAV